MFTSSSKGVKWLAALPQWRRVFPGEPQLGVKPTITPSKAQNCLHSDPDRAGHPLPEKPLGTVPCVSHSDTKTSSDALPMSSVGAAMLVSRHGVLWGYFTRAPGKNQALPHCFSPFFSISCKSAVCRRSLQVVRGGIRCLSNKLLPRLQWCCYLCHKFHDLPSTGH